MRVRHAGIAWLLALAVATGCATSQPPTPGLPLPPSEAERAAFGTVGVTVAVAPAQGANDLPSGGVLEGAGTGLERWESACGVVLPIFFYGPEVILLGGPIVGGALAIVSMPVFVVTGAIDAPSREEAARATAVVRPILEDAAAGDVFAARFVEAAETVAGARCVAAEDASSVVELRVERIELRPQSDGSIGADILAIVVTGRARVVRAPDGVVLYDGAFAGGNPAAAQRFIAWAADDGRGLRGAIDAALGHVATALAEEIFLVDRTLAAPREVRP
jgi:hypothetical protein